MKKLLAILLIVLLLAQAMPAGASSAAGALPNSDPIAKGTINKVTYIRWGKGEMFPTLALVGPGKKLDVYEFDKTWVMVLYETWVSQGMSGGGAHSFYGFVKRADIDCDPELEGDESDKADTGPGKRKGKKPKPQPTSGASADPSAEPNGTDAGESAEPEPTVEISDEEYDWIIRTPGLCNVTVKIQEATFTCSFALMAQKAGGLGPSSDPAYNHGMRTPYAAMASFGMVAKMQDVLENLGGDTTKYLYGTGGIEITGQAAGTRFFIDTGALDPALVNFTLKMQGTGILNPMITDGEIIGRTETTVNMPFDLPVQLKKTGGGYKFVLVGMKPGGGDLEFPAVLEKAFADPDRWDKEAKEADRRRKETDRMLKELQEKIKKQMQDEYRKQQEEQDKKDSETTDPMTVEDENGEDVDLAPLVTPAPLDPDFTPAPLVTDDPLAPLVTPDDGIPLAPLVPTDDEEVNGFPSGK